MCRLLRLGDSVRRRWEKTPNFWGCVQRASILSSQLNSVERYHACFLVVYCSVVSAFCASESMEITCEMLRKSCSVSYVLLVHKVENRARTCHTLSELGDSVLCFIVLKPISVTSTFTSFLYWCRKSRTTESSPMASITLTTAIQPPRPALFDHHNSLGCAPIVHVSHSLG